MLARSLLSLALCVAATQAIQITKPSKNDGWQSTGSQVIEWSSVNTDPDSFTIYITQPGSDAKQVVEKSVKTDDKSFIYTPTKDLAVQDGYRLSFESEKGGILAESEQFGVEKGVSSVKPTSTESLTTGGSTSAPSSATSTGSGTTSATSESASSTEAPNNGAGALAVPSGLLVLITSAMIFFA
ncbi:hypothetical protein I317_02206 [Kwoniella heveanensis CBS 569]|nr:hypothetical protein I317_02206 [Kwoniella heveanensis CBS 569]